MVKIQKRFYEEFWRTVIIKDHPDKYGATYNMINPKSKVLEIGCGEGILLSKLKKEKNCDVTGIEISDLAANIAKKKSIKIIKGNVEEILPLKEHYDYIICLDIIEHLFFPDEFFRKIKKSCDYLITAVPNACWWKTRLAITFGKVSQLNAFKNGQHTQYWSYREFKSFAQSFGFKLVDESGLGGFPFIGRFHIKLAKKLAKINKNLFYMSAVQKWKS